MTIDQSFEAYITSLNEGFAKINEELQRLNEKVDTVLMNMAADEGAIEDTEVF